MHNASGAKLATREHSINIDKNNLYLDGREFVIPRQRKWQRNTTGVHWRISHSRATCRDVQRVSGKLSIKFEFPL